MKNLGLNFLYLILIGVLVISCQNKKNSSNSGKAKSRGGFVPIVQNPINENILDSEENSENNNEEELEEDEVNKIIITPKGFAVLNNEGVVNYEGYDPVDAGWARFDTIKTSLVNIKNIYWNNNAEHPAFVALSKEGNIFTWGDKTYGGDPTYESNEYPEVVPANGALTNGYRVFYTQGAFAVLKKDKTVVSWGGKEYGGDSTYNYYTSGESSPLTNIVSISSINKSSTNGAFAALKTDKTIEMWGVLSQGCGDESSSGEFNHVDKIFVNDGAFAMLKDDKTVVTRGDYCYGGDAKYNYGDSVIGDLINVEKVLPNGNTFVAVKTNGNAILWGGENYGEKDVVSENLNGIENFLAKDIALKSNNTIIFLNDWSSMTHVEDVFGNGGYSFVLKDDGTASMIWEHDDAVMVQGSKMSSINSSLSSINNVKYIVSPAYSGFYSVAHAVLTKNGDVFTFGDSGSGGDPNSEEENIIKPVGSLTNVKDLVGTSTEVGGSFAIVRNDGTATSWGHADSGADTSRILGYTGSNTLTSIEKIYSSNGGAYFVGVRADGTYIAWGNYAE